MPKRGNSRWSIGLAQSKQELETPRINVSSLRSVWFNSTIGFGRVAQIPKGNENVV
jgi:hypothetical protein